jgi:hypothetical protein
VGPICVGLFFEGFGFVGFVWFVGLAEMFFVGQRNLNLLEKEHYYEAVQRYYKNQVVLYV